MAPRTLFQNRKPPPRPASGGKASPTSVIRRSNPEDEKKTDWKPIIIGSVISAVVFTVVGAVLGRIIHKTLETKPMKALGLGDENEKEPIAQNPASPGYSLPPAPHVAPSASMTFSANPYGQPGYARSPSLPEAPHVGPMDVEREPSWFRAFRETQERRLSEMERAIRDVSHSGE